MNELRGHSDGLRRRVIAIFFLGLLFMAGIAMGIGWVCDDWGRISLGWLNQALGPALTVGGFVIIGWSVRIQIYRGKRHTRAEGRYSKAGEDWPLRLYS